MLSAPQSLGRGVPQEAVLSPMIFTIFMSDLVEHLSSTIRWLIYADDIFLCSVSDSILVGRSHLQDALRVASQLFNWKMNICPVKCSAINLLCHKGGFDFDFYINGRLISWAREIKFLGFIITRWGGFQRHVDFIRKNNFTRVNILKSITSRHLGARSRHLLMLANSVVVSSEV